MADKTDGVLAVLRKEIEHAGCLGPRASDARAKRLTKVADAVAELLAADEEYDKANARWISWGRPGSGKAFSAFMSAMNRRAAAIRAMRGDE